MARQPGTYAIFETSEGTIACRLFELRLRWNSLSSTRPEPRVAEALDGNRTVLHRVDLQKDNGEIRLRCEPGIFAYRLK